jgi:acetate kinase
MDILTLNCGSSSLKYQLYSWDTRQVLSKGIVERVTVGGSFIEHYARGKGKVKKEQDCPNHKVALELVLSMLTHPEHGAIGELSRIKAVGHRVVHGGERFAQSVIIDEAALATFKELADLAPLHNPPNILGIEAAQAVLPGVPHCAVMDTAWHQTMPPAAYLYALPYAWYAKHGVRRYGFHGTSFLYVAKRAAVLLGKDPFQTNLILLHIGNGASANAVRAGVSVDTSMGFTPLEGLVMGTRSGDIDAAVVPFLERVKGMAVAEVDRLLNKQSGLLGLSGVSNDMRTLLQAEADGNERAALALDVYCYRIRKYVGAYTAVLGEVHAVVFTAGVGENSFAVRERSLSGLERLGYKLDAERNRQAVRRELDVAAADSPIRILVVPTNEELLIAQDTYELARG